MVAFVLFFSAAGSAAAVWVARRVRV
jgi:hypothetical protein